MGPTAGTATSPSSNVWEVWRDLADHFALDPDRTTIGGYSMGGFGTYHLALDHPDLFAAAVILAAAPRDAASSSANPRDELPRLENARWLPIYHAHGALDELVPVAEALRGVDMLDRLGYRYRFDLFPAADHVVTSLQDGFDQAAAFMAEGDRHRVTDPARFTYRWFPSDVDDRLGIGPHGAWWVRGLTAREPDLDGRVDAVSHALSYRPPTPVRSTSSVATVHPSPGVRHELSWRLGAPLPRRPVVDIVLTNVRRARVDLVAAGLDGEAGEHVAVDTDGAVSLTLAGLSPGTVVRRDGATAGRAGRGGVTVALAAGTHLITFVPAGAP